MNYKEQFTEDIDRLYAENDISNQSYFDTILKDVLTKSPNDELIRKISIKWYKRSKSIELFWDFTDSTFVYKFHISYRISETNISWRIRYSGKDFNEEDNGGKDFFEHVNDCLEFTKQVKANCMAKPNTKDEFCYHLISTIEFHFSAIANCEGYVEQDLVLGVNPINCNTVIDTKERLSSYDIYDLKIYTDCFETDNYGWCELKNKEPIWELATKYIPNDCTTETRESQLKNIKKIDSKEFRRKFYHAVYEYLQEQNTIKGDRMPVFQKLKCLRKKYLGVDPLSLKPFVGIIEGLDGCDLYDLDEIARSFEVDESGRYASSDVWGTKFLLKDKTLINLLVDKYFSSKQVDDTRLPLVRKAEEHNIDDNSTFKKVYRLDYRDMFTHYSTIVGKYSDTSYCEDYCFRPIFLIETVALLEQAFKEHEEGTFKVIRYLDKAREHKRNKKYKLAITALEKAVSILHNLEYVGYPEVHSCLIDCYSKEKDRDNQIRVIKMAIELYNNPKFTMMLKRLEGIEADVVLRKSSYQVSPQYNYGEMYDRHVRKKLPEFSFGKIHINPDVLEYADMLPVIRRIDKYFQSSLKEGSVAEAKEDYETAVEIYERLIAEGIYTPNAYERLIVLYSKANRNHDLIRVLQDGINFFEERKLSQLEYVRSLAKKYGAEDYCEKCIETGEKIRYVGGYIILYQPYPFIDKWEKRLAKRI